MKIRSGFVSNSSSSSFCIVGLYLTNTNKIQDRFGVDYIDDVKFPEDIKGKIDTYSPEGDYGGYIGTTIYEMKEEETLRQFKERVLGYINSVVPEGKKSFTIEDMNIHEEAYWS